MIVGLSPSGLPFFHSMISMIFGNNRIFRVETTNGKTGNWTKRQAENGQEKRRERLEERRCVSLLFRLCEVYVPFLLWGVARSINLKGALTWWVLYLHVFFVLKGDMKPRMTPNQKNMLSLGQASWCCRCKGEDQNQVGFPSTNQGFEWLNPNIFNGGNVGEYWFRSSWLLMYARLCWNSIFETSADPFIYFKISFLKGQFVWFSSLEEHPPMWDDQVFPQILLNQRLCIFSLMALM